MLRTRIASAIVMLLVTAAALWGLGPRGWAIACAAILTIGAWEWARLAGLSGRACIAMGAVFAAAYILVAVWSGAVDGRVMSERALPIYAIGAVFWIIAAPIWLAVNPRKPPAYVVIACAALTLIPAYLGIVELRSFGIGAFVMVCAIVWIADIAAYFFGRTLGRNKLAPSISPGKTWEGALGGVATVALYAACIARPFNEQMGLALPLLVMVLAAMVLAALSIVGDLYESALKRQAGLKDSGRLLPGHGGVLDRLDAMIAVLPIAMLGALAGADR